MDAETWMTAAEACDKGIAESVLQADAIALAAIDISRFKSLPAAIAARLHLRAPDKQPLRIETWRPLGSLPKGALEETWFPYVSFDTEKEKANARKLS